MFSWKTRWQSVRSPTKMSHTFLYLISQNDTYLLFWMFEYHRRRCSEAPDCPLFSARQYFISNFTDSDSSKCKVVQQTTTFKFFELKNWHLIINHEPATQTTVGRDDIPVVPI